MRITVALTPKLLREPETHAVAVVDVLRATSSLVTMFERGLLRALMSPNLRHARTLAQRNFSLLCGEVGAVPPAGFDFGNSPAEFAETSFRGKSAVIYTTNGTKALGAAAKAPVALAASLLNRRAAARRLVDEAAKRGVDICVMCAGRERGAAYSLEDSVAAGAIVEAVREVDGTVHMTDGSWAALHLWRFYRGDAMRAFRQSVHGRALASMGFDRDLEFVSQLDRYDAVPIVYDEDGTVTLRARLPRRAARTEKRSS